MTYLVLVRHGETEYNAKGLWTGWEDPPLNNEGKEEALSAGRKIKNLDPDVDWVVFVSPLTRAVQTAHIAIEKAGLYTSRIVNAPALVERNYGVYTGKNKWEIEKSIGHEEFIKLRRGFDYPIEEGESLKQVYQRVIPWYVDQVVPLLEEGTSVLIFAHGNSLRALVKYLDGIDDTGVEHLELETGRPRVYDVKDGVLTRRIHE